MEKLNRLTQEQKYAKPFPEKDHPYYSDSDKKIIAWSLIWEGTVTIENNKNYYEPIITITNTNFEALENFKKIIKLGKIAPCSPATEKRKPTKILRITGFRQVLFVLQQLNGYMPCEKYRKLRNLISEFCASRIEANNTAKLNHTHPRPYSKREHEIHKEVKKLNKRGRKLKKDGHTR